MVVVKILKFESCVVPDMRTEYVSSTVSRSVSFLAFSRWVSLEIKKGFSGGHSSLTVLSMSSTVHARSIERFLLETPSETFASDADKEVWEQNWFWYRSMDELQNFASSRSNLVFDWSPPPPDPNDYNPDRDSRRNMNGQQPLTAQQRSAYNEVSVISGMSSKYYKDCVFEVQFKHCFRYYTRPPTEYFDILIGSFVIVKAEKGEDLGIVTSIQTMNDFLASKANQRPSTNDEDNELGTILRIASHEDRNKLPAKLRKEIKILNTAVRLVQEVHKLPMEILGAEYQFDYQKLTIHYTSKSHVDFRELLRDLYYSGKVRVWMKKVNLSAGFKPKKFASMALATGMAVNDDKLLWY